MQEGGFWFAVAVFFIAALLVVFVFGGCVGFWVSSKLKPMPVEFDGGGDIVYICSGKPSCYHMVAVWRGGYETFEAM